MSALLWLLKPGDRVIVERDIYGGTFRIFNEIARKYGIDASFVDTSDLEAFKEALNDKVKLVVVESVSNPLMKLTDIAAVADLCHRNGTLLVVDNTFLSPYFMRPLELGADIVLHSTTKYLGGHSDLIGGVLATNDADLAERLHYLQNANGVIPSPFDCWLALRSVKTLEVRMRAHNSNALQVARFLESHPKVDQVYYPGLESHPQYELATSADRRIRTESRGRVVCFRSRWRTWERRNDLRKRLRSLCWRRVWAESRVCWRYRPR